MEGIDRIDLRPYAREIRYGERFKTEGVNVNLVEKSTTGLKMRTYERGVEDETYSCGTGVTAAVISAHRAGVIQSHSAQVSTKGGQLSLRFSEDNGSYHDIWLEGPAQFVFQGEYPWKA
jgi:diaminopimelate epimerase